jgi:hypothetical protein
MQCRAGVMNGRPVTVRAFVNWLALTPTLKLHQVECNIRRLPVTRQKGAVLRIYPATTHYFGSIGSGNPSTSAV